MKWKAVQIGAVTKIVSGSTPKSGNPAFWGGSIPWATPTDLSGLETKELSATGRKITKEGYESCSANMLPARSVLFSSRAPIGLVAINKEPVCTNQGFKSFVPDSARLSSDFLYWWLKCNRASLEHLGRGATFKEVSKSIIETVEIPLPPLDEQKRIAAILDAADALRAKRRQSIAQLDALIQSTFLDLFGDPRRQGSVGEVATVSKLLGELTRIRTGKLDANAADEDGAYPFFTCAVKPLRINTPAFDCKAVLVAGNGDLNVKYHEGKFNAYQRTYVIESLNERSLDPRFLFAYLDLYVSELRKQAIGGVIKYIKLPYLTKAVIQLPSLTAQRDFAAIIESIERQKTTQRTHLAELDALFASLQHRAFRGEL